ncbi:assimilatory sulfite reductase (NADPH) flavoprotein subunit [Aerolutibacter ruishenii]|uniref:assimilatory sulfite reductase (NADPH) n=1 Tax=Aerolutibacter ruishenii TaxID=686800 RepID=A0A562LPJ7_9GAMM|nr:assimilatory sulfite reductase (NADPH) flavoprotein subunit [Lysobacter ruishenii]TWI09488.1 sulfite reductase (NADPH) flavoprotein alpha-component [Lysobacter ruishenii]
MSALPAFSAPPSLLSPAQSDLVETLTTSLDGAGLWWLSGYAAGLARAQALPTTRPMAVPAADAQPAPTLTIVYGSQTGNARRAAESLAQQVEAAGLGVRVLRADTYATRELKQERHLIVVISTQGDGDPPDDARGFVEFITGKRAPRLPELQFAVLGLGDSSYPQFCAVGRVLDERFAALGAKRWLPRGDADLDIETVATPWLANALTVARESLKPQAPLATVTPLRPLAAATSAYTRDNPFHAELLANQRITGRNRDGAWSDKDIRHIELSLEGSGLHYQAGDALGVWPHNPPQLVDAVLTTLALDGEQPVAHGGTDLPLREWLSSRRELTRLSRPFVVSHAARAKDAALDARLVPDNAAGLADLLAHHQLIDLLRAHPAPWSAEALVASLRPLVPRLYSIASSSKAVGDEAHLTVAHIEYRVETGTDDDGTDGLRWGAASSFLARAAEGERIRVFIEPNERFRLPTDGSRDVIMIGPGTGVAPFRGFLQERDTTGATGRNWLFFGNPHARTDFLYQSEWQDALRRGRLHRLDLAFSRDALRAITADDASAAPARKTYVQDRLREHGAEVFAWLEGGAHLYVCGDATRMAKDVHAALLALIAEHGGRSAEDAAEYLNALQAQGRYARDVY